MAIARIITSMPELSGGLVRDLNSRGFEVHILSPEQTISGSADLEIRLDVEGSQQVMADVFANNSLAMQAASDPASPGEDIWAMLAAFDGDAEKASVAQEAVPQESALVEQDATASVADSVEALTSPVVAREEEASQVPVEAVAQEKMDIAAEAAAPEKTAYEHVDPELVPSMYNFSGDLDSGALQETVPAAEEKHYLDGNDFRDLMAKKNGGWNFPKPRVMAVAGWAAVALLLIFSFMHHQTAVPPNANAGQVPFHPTAPTGSVVPVKSVLITNTGVPIKTLTKPSAGTAADIAEDTIVHYGKAKAATLVPEKHTGIKYYSDMD